MIGVTTHEDMNIHGKKNLLEKLSQVDQIMEKGWMKNGKW
jgi:hypothetical protein